MKFEYILNLISLMMVKSPRQFYNGWGTIAILKWLNIGPENGFQNQFLQRLISLFEAGRR